VESFADRLCITGEAPSGTIISPEPILECSAQGCDGGWPSTAWSWMINNGDTTCTGQCFQGCAPYDSGAGSSPSCHKGTCDGGTSWKSVYNPGSYQSLQSGNLTLFMSELSTYGPLQACFNVYENFYTFFDEEPTGIYNRTSGPIVGGHCVKLIGWGTQNGMDYWQYANSWDTTWGDQGYFKVVRGKNLAGIEASVTEGFTKKQSEARKQFGVQITTPQKLVGGWQEQTDFTSSLVLDVIEEALDYIAMGLRTDIDLKKIVSVHTQVVAGVNYRLILGVDDDTILKVSLHRNLYNEYEVRNFEFVE
jgi:hypothetical protein